MWKEPIFKIPSFYSSLTDLCNFSNFKEPWNTIQIRKHNHSEVLDFQQKYRWNFCCVFHWCVFFHLFSKIVSIFHNSSYLLHPIVSFPVGCFWYVIYGLSSFPFSNCLLLLALLDKFNFELVLFCIPGNSNLFSPPVGFLALILISDSEWFLLNKDGPRKLFIWFIFSALLKMWC